MKGGCSAGGEDSKSPLATQLATDTESNGGVGAQIVFTRVIVHPDGHREIQGVTPKALPAPEPDETKAIER